MKKTLLVLIALVTVSSCVKSIWGETTHDFYGKKDLKNY